MNSAAIIGVIAASRNYTGSGEGISGEITNITVSYVNDQRIDEPITVTATPAGVVTNWVWSVYNARTNQLVSLSLSQNPTFNITEVGIYHLRLVAYNTTDSWIQRFDHAFYVDYPRFTEEEADIVVDLSSGSYFQDFANADNSGLKIALKGVGTGYFQPYRLRGTPSNPVRIQVVESTTITTPSGTSHAMWINDCSDVIIDGYLEGGTRGLKLQSTTANVTQLFMCTAGAWTGVHVKGMVLEHDRAFNIDAAAMSFIPSAASASLNATNHVAENMVIYGCQINSSGEEGIYFMYNNDNFQGSYQPFKSRGAFIVRNVINNAGRDAIQFGSSCDLICANNICNGYGLNHEASHESGLSFNGGNSNCLVYQNYFINGEMHINLQAGVAPWDVEDGETTPSDSYFFSNIFIQGSYTSGTTLEPFAIYGQSPSGLSGVLDFHMIHNTFICDKKFYEFLYPSPTFTSTGATYANNIIIKVGNAGDTPEINFTGPGTQPTGYIINNLVREEGSESDILFTDADNGDVTISSFLSTAYSGSPTDVASRLPELSNYMYDYSGFPLLVPGEGYTFGAYSGYHKRTIEYTPADPSPATFTSPVAVSPLPDGGTITFEANKVGILYWTVVANNDPAPTVNQVIAGSGLISGEIVDIGTALSGLISGLTDGTAYDLYAVFVTVDGIKQTSVTKVDFNTTSDVTAPTIISRYITNANKDRVYIEFDEPVTGSTTTGFTIASPSKTITGVTMVSSTVYYFTVNSEFILSDSPTLAYSGGSNFQDTASTPNSLATFGATAITNNITPSAAETWTNGQSQNVTYVDGTVTSTGAGGIKSGQYIPAASDGYIRFGFLDPESTGSTTQIRIGLIGSAETFTYSTSQLDFDLNFATNSNTDCYENDAYRDTQGGIQVEGNLFRFRVVRLGGGLANIFLEWSTNGGSSWNNFYTYSSVTVGDLHGAISMGVSGKSVPNLTIQADLGLG